MSAVQLSSGNEMKFSLVLLGAVNLCAVEFLYFGSVLVSLYTQGTQGTEVHGIQWQYFQAEQFSQKLREFYLNQSDWNIRFYRG